MTGAAPAALTPSRARIRAMTATPPSEIAYAIRRASQEELRTTSVNYRHRTRTDSSRFPDTGHDTRDTGYGGRDTGYGIRDRGYGIGTADARYAENGTDRGWDIEDA